jgi:hypothetical protein
MRGLTEGSRRPVPAIHVKASVQFIVVLFAGISFWPIGVHSQNQAQDVTCQNGSGEYSSRFFTGTTVSVGPLRKGGFAERACVAKLAWGSEEITVASDAARVGIDALGADLGLGKPVVAFQIDKTGDGANRSYQIYSLIKPPRLLYTITGADSYAAADTDLDGQVEIWTDDAAAVNGFEGVPLQSFDFAPTVVLHFEKKRLVDVSSEFTSHYDAQIADLRAQIDARELAAFKNSDGLLSLEIPRSSDERHRLARTKIKVLETVWAYLYSGRDAEAWSALQEMWPSQDFNRIRLTMSDVRRRGILRGIDRASGRSMHKHRVHIYDATGSSGAVSWNALNRGGVATDATEQESAVVQPKSILLRRPPPDEAEQFRATDAVMELVVDAAGKVRSAKLLNGTDKRWIEASAGWHFIPAFRDGSPVACRFRLSVWDLK